MDEAQRKAAFSILIRVSREESYDAIATSEGIDKWFTSGATVDARPGGSVHFRWKDYGLHKYTGENYGPVLEAQRPERFVFQWKADSGGYYTTVAIDFVEQPAGTVVSLNETGYIDGPIGFQDLMNRQSGWAHVLTLLKFYLEHGVRY